MANKPRIPGDFTLVLCPALQACDEMKVPLTDLVAGRCCEVSFPSANDLVLLTSTLR